MVSVSFPDFLRLMAELEGMSHAQTPNNFHVLPDNESMWLDILSRSRERNSLLCLEITGSWSPAAKRAQPDFIRLASITDVPFLRVDIPQQMKSRVHDKVKETVGGVVAVPTYAILDFTERSVTVQKFEGSDSLAKGEVEACLRRIVAERNTRTAAARMMGGVFSAAFMAAEFEEMKERKRRQEEDRSRAAAGGRDQTRSELIGELKSMDLQTVPIKSLKAVMTKLNISYVGCTTREDLVDLVKQEVPELHHSATGKEWASSYGTPGGMAEGMEHMDLNAL